MNNLWAKALFSDPAGECPGTAKSGSLSPRDYSNDWFGKVTQSAQELAGQLAERRGCSFRLAAWRDVEEVESKTTMGTKQSRLTDTPKVGRKDRTDDAVDTAVDAPHQEQELVSGNKGQGERATAKATAGVAGMERGPLVQRTGVTSHKGARRSRLEEIGLTVRRGTSADQKIACRGVSYSMNSASAAKTAFQREVAGRFGLMPNFFSSAPDAPEIIERLWSFAKAGYLDNPPHFLRIGCSSIELHLDRN